MSSMANGNALINTAASRGAGCVARGDRPPAGPRWKRENAGTRCARERGGVGFASCVIVVSHEVYSHMKPLSGKRARIQRAEDGGVAAVDISLHATERQRRHLRR